MTWILQQSSSILTYSNATCDEWRVSPNLAEWLFARATSHTRGSASRRGSAPPGSRSLTVAKLDEAAAYLATGFDDVCAANEIVGIDKWRRLVGLRQPGKVAIGVDRRRSRWSGTSAAGFGVEIPVRLRSTATTGGCAAHPPEEVARIGRDEGQTLVDTARTQRRLQRCTRATIGRP